MDILDEDGASNIAHPELFGKENKSEILKTLKSGSEVKNQEMQSSVKKEAETKK